MLKKEKKSLNFQENSKKYVQFDPSLSNITFHVFKHKRIIPTCLLMFISEHGNYSSHFFS